MARIIVLTIVEFIAGLCSFLGIGQAVDKKATKFDKIAGFVICMVFLLFIIFVEEVVK